MVDRYLPSVNVNPSFSNQLDRSGIRLVLLFENAGSQGVGVIIGKDRYDRLHDDGACIDATVDKVHCATGKACSVIECLLLHM